MDFARLLDTFDTHAVAINFTKSSEMKKYFSLLFNLLLTASLFAQGETGANELFKSNLKIFVPVGVLTIILLCIFLFLFSIEKRLKKMEEEKGK
jgi:hypothetical protein